MSKQEARQTRLGILYVILSSVGYGSTAVIIIKAYQAGATAWQVLLAQCLIAWLFLTSILIWRGGTLARIGSKIFWIALSGVCGYATMHVSYTLSLQYIPGSMATLIFFTYPVLVALGSWAFFKEQFSVRKIAALFLALTGVFLTSGLLAGASGTASLSGICLSLTAALGSALLTLLGEKLLKEISPLDMALTQLFFSTSTILVFILVTGQAHPHQLSVVTWYWAALLTVATSLLPTFLTLKGIASMGAYRASVVATTEIPITLLFVFTFLQESLTGLQWVGSGLILGSLLLLKYK